MSDDKVLSDKDIDNIWKSVKSVSSDDAMRMIKNHGVIKPMTMSNGYFALLSLDPHNGERKEYHLSISNPFGIANFEIASAMARDILGDCDQLYVGFRDIYHFVKNADKEGIHNINKNKEKNKEEKLNDGKVEGDVNNGIEGRVKKKIQTKGIVERSYRDWENVFGGQSGRICSVKRMESSISRS